MKANKEPCAIDTIANVVPKAATSWGYGTFHQNNPLYINMVGSPANTVSTVPMSGPGVSFHPIIVTDFVNRQSNDLKVASPQKLSPMIIYAATNNLRIPHPSNQ